MQQFKKKNPDRDKRKQPDKKKLKRTNSHKRKLQLNFWQPRKQQLIMQPQKLQQPIKENLKQELMLKHKQEQLFLRRHRLNLKDLLLKLLKDKSEACYSNKLRQKKRGKQDRLPEKHVKLQHWLKNKRKRPQLTKRRKPLTRPNIKPNWRKLLNKRDLHSKRLTLRKTN